MLLDCIRAGDRMEIQHRFERKLPKAYVSQVQEVLPNGQFIAYSPMEYGNVVRLPNGDDCSIVFFTDKGIFKFDGKVVKNVASDGVYFVVLRLLTEGEKIQRRDFYRYECMLDFTFAAIDESAASTGYPTLSFDFEGVIKDIGGGGVRFVSNDDVNEKTEVCCRIAFAEDVVILPIGAVLHKQTFPKSNYAYQYRVQFNVIRPDEQEKIIQFIFEQQRKKLRRK